MLPIRKVFLMLAAIIALGLSAPAVHADQVVIGGTNADNAFPFGADSYVGAYQQVYGSSAFASGSVTITQIAFASVPQAFVRNLNLSLGLSTTTRPVNGLSTDYSANRGPDFTIVFSGVQHFTATGGGTFNLVFNITPFTYNPSHGNLLLDVFINSSSGGLGFFVAGNNSPQTSRVFNLFGHLAPQADMSGLRTQFTTTEAIPEPATMLLLGTGLAGVVSAVSKRRKAHKSEEV